MKHHNEVILSDFLSLCKRVVLEILALLCYTHCVIHEELPENDEVIYGKQANKVINHQRNTSRHQVRPAVIVFWYLLALIAVCLWTLQILGYLPSIW